MRLFYKAFFAIPLIFSLSMPNLATSKETNLKYHFTGTDPLTLHACNQSSEAISLKKLTLQLQYQGGIRDNAWGSPYLNWHIEEDTNTITLTGGTPWSADLQPDPNCESELTISFSPKNPGASLPSKITLNGKTSDNNTGNNENNNNKPEQPPVVNPPQNTDGLLVGYFESWSDRWANKGENTTLAKLPNYVGVINIAFAKPDMIYSGNDSLEGTGLNFSYSGKVLKEAINAIHRKNANTKVILAIGGATYHDWNNMSVQAITQFVKDYGFDGVDIDYEEDTACHYDQNTQKITCAKSQEYINIVKQLRQAMPKPMFISLAAWSIGAYGQGNEINSQPQASRTGNAIELLSTVGDQLDQINVMSYDASNAYNSIEALHAYRHYFKGTIAMGIEVPPEAWGGHVTTMHEANQLIDASIVDAKENSTLPAIMLWSLQKRPLGIASESNPSANMYANAVCRRMHLGDCDKER